MVKKYDMSNVAIDNLIEISRRRIENVETHFLRELYRDVEWKSRLILLKGCRGVGKTYMMLQRLKSSDEKVCICHWIIFIS
ncbi:MAG: hypothetical protein IPO94_00095 [Saprospiraceae bacterium]|nr:hypothetical protein [Saprospiraceae bacterium]